MPLIKLRIVHSILIRIVFTLCFESLNLKVEIFRQLFSTIPQLTYYEIREMLTCSFIWMIITLRFMRTPTREQGEQQNSDQIPQHDFLLIKLRHLKYECNLPYNGPDNLFANSFPYLYC